MILFICLILGLLIAYFVSRPSGWTNYVSGGAIGGVFGFVALLVGSIIISDSSKAWNWNASHELRSTKIIVAMKDGIGLHGSFFLGIGKVGNNIQYYYYEKQDDGAMILKELSAKRVKVYYKEKENSVIERYTKVGTIKSPLLGKLFFMSKPKYSGTTYKIYVPEGSIRTDFVLDAE